jgi:phytanoyl-CoA hydroxylase
MTILTREQVDFYDDNGYLIVRQLVDLQMVEEIREALMAVQEGKREGMRRRLEKDFSDGRLSKVERLWDIDPTFGRFLQTSKVGEVAGELMHTSAVRLFFDELIYKIPKTGGSVPCHQDYDGFREVSTSNLVTAWVATGKVDEENGCLYVIPGSHKWGLIDRVKTMQTLDPGPEGLLNDGLSPEQKAQVVRVSLELEPGDVSFHHGLAIHCSYRNVSDRPRLGWVHHYLPADARYVEARDLHHSHEIDVEDGELIDTARFPLVWRATAAVSD